MKFRQCVVQVAFGVDIGGHGRLQRLGLLRRTAGAGVGTSDNAGGTTSTFRFPRGIAGDAAGNVFVADTLNHLIRRLSVFANNIVRRARRGLYPGVKEPIGGLPAIDTGGQAGLYDIVPHPRFAQNDWLYLA